MKLTLAEPRYLKDSISIISDLVSEARFKITKQGLKLVAMDPANVAMVIFELFSSAFIDYELKEEVELALNLGNLKQVLRRAKQSDMLSIEMKDESKLTIVLKSNTTRTFSLPIIELDEKEQKVPELKFASTITMPCDNLNEAIEDVDVVAESVAFETVGTKFTISAEGDTTKAEIIVPAGESVKIKSTDDKIRAKYSVEYLKKMIGGSKLAENVEISLSNDYPLRLDYKAIDKVSLSFILAPRVEED